MPSAPISIDRHFLKQVLADMVSIDSTNPSLSPDGKGEARIAAYVSQALAQLGLEVRRDELAPGRFNVTGVLPGSGGGRSLLLNAHMDTVGVEGMKIDPFGAEERDGRLYGRGAQDMKGSLAAMLAAAKALVDHGISLKGDLLITGVADEEHSSLGMEALVQQVSPDAAIVTEPTDMHICRAHRGFIWFDVETVGRAAHGSRFREGIDANMHMGRFLHELEKLGQELLGREAHPLAGPPSLHAARLRGGREVSVYAAHCRLQIERRTIPGESESQALGELQAIIERISASDPQFQARVRATFQREPFEVREDAAIVRVLEGALQARLGGVQAHSGQTFWTDAALLAEAGVETVLLGPVGAGLHSAEEWVDLHSVEDLAYVLADAALRFCG
jgi:acetylornithine deacetylase